MTTIDNLDSGNIPEEFPSINAEKHLPKETKKPVKQLIRFLRSLITFMVSTPS